MAHQSREEFSKYYESIRKRTRSVATCIPEERITPGDLVRHIAAAERWAWAENVKGRPSRYPGHGPELAEGKAAVLEYLNRAYTWPLSDSQISRLPTMVTVAVVIRGIPPKVNFVVRPLLRVFIRYIRYIVSGPCLSIIRYIVPKIALCSG